jgi:hypothetical protein
LLLWLLRPGARNVPVEENHNQARNVQSQTVPAGSRVALGPPPLAPRPAAPAQGTSQAVFPTEFRGIWGTSADSCAGRDDYGPLVVGPRSFDYYEAYGTLARAPRVIGPRAIEARFAADHDSIYDDGFQPAFSETWALNERSDLLTVRRGSGPRQTFMRCPPGTRNPF